MHEHRWGSKVIQSGFFDLPDAENVSAVMFNNGATISKFNRMGLLAGFGSRRVLMIQRSAAIDHDPNASEPKLFARKVDERFMESWMEGMDVYHNPRAKHPLDPALVPGAAHHHLRADEQIETTAPEWRPLGSITLIVVPKAEPDAQASEGR